MKTFKDFGITTDNKGFKGDKIKIERILNREVTVQAFKIVDSQFKGKCLHLQILLNNTSHVVFTGSVNLMDMIQQVKQEDFPFTTTIVKENERYDFT